MARSRKLRLLLFLIALPTYLLSAQNSAPWRDPSPHKTQFVTVDKDVKLEVLDWGGTGRRGPPPCWEYCARLRRLRTQAHRSISRFRHNAPRLWRIKCPGT